MRCAPFAYVWFVRKRVIYIYIYTHTHTYIYVHMLEHTQMNAVAGMCYIRTHCLYLYKLVDAYVCVYAVCVCLFVSVFFYYIYMYIYIYVYIMTCSVLRACVLCLHA
jgi:hypothetical protein